MLKTLGVAAAALCLLAHGAAAQSPASLPRGPDELIRPSAPTKHYAPGATLIEQPTLRIRNVGVAEPGKVNLRISDPRKRSDPGELISLAAGEREAWVDVIVRLANGRVEGVGVLHQIYLARINSDGSIEAFADTSVEPLE